MDQLVKPHGKDKVLKPLLLTGKELTAERKRAATLKKFSITSRETGDAIMMGIGGFTPLTGFMSKRTGRASAPTCRWWTGRSGRFR